MTQLERSFDEIIDGDERAALTDSERRLAPTQPAVPIREVELGRGSHGTATVEPGARRDHAVAAAEALDVTRADAPIETAPDEHRIAVAEASAAAPSRFAAMGLVDDELADVDVHAAFLRRVG